MAAPTIRSSAVSTRASNATSDTITAPSSIVDGDLLVLLYAKDGNVNTLNNPSGFSALGSPISDPYDVDTCSKVSTKTASSESGNYTGTSTETERFSAWIGAISGTSGVNAKAEAANTSNDSTVEAPTVTTTVDDCLILYLITVDDVSGTVTATGPGSPVSFDKEQSQNSGAYVGVFYETKATAGTTTARTFTMNVSEQWVCRTIALAPSGGSSQTVVANHLASTVALHQPSAAPGAVTVVANHLGPTGSLHQPSATPGAVTVAANHLGPTASLHQASVSAVTEVTANHVGPTAALYQPTVAPGAVTAVANHIGPAASLHQPAVSPGAVTVAANLIGPTSSAHQPAVTAGAATVVANHLGPTGSTYQPTVAPGAVTVVANHLGPAGSLHQPAAAPGAVSVGANHISTTALHQPAVVHVPSIPAGGTGAPLSTVYDDFDDSSVNAGWADSTGSITESGGRLTIAYAGGERYLGAGTYTFDQAHVEVPSFTLWGSGTTITIYLLVWVDGSNNCAVVYENDQLHIQARDAGANEDSAGITYDATNHRWWRIRNVAGTVHFETSPDGREWTDPWSEPKALSWASGAQVYVYLDVTTARTTGSASFDNFNVLPAVAGQQTVVANHLGPTSSLHQPSALAVTTVAGNHLGPAATAHQPAVTPGVVTVGAGHISSTALQQHAVTPGVVTVGAGTLATTALHQPAVAPGAVSVGTNLVATTALYQPAVTPGSVTVVVPHLGPRATVHAPLILPAGAILAGQLATTVLYQPAVVPFAPAHDMRLGDLASPWETGRVLAGWGAGRTMVSWQAVNVEVGGT